MIRHLGLHGHGMSRIGLDRMLLVILIINRYKCIPFAAIKDGGLGTHSELMVYACAMV